MQRSRRLVSEALLAVARLCMKIRYLVGLIRIATIAIFSVFAQSRT